MQSEPRTAGAMPAFHKDTETSVPASLDARRAGDDAGGYDKERLSSGGVRGAEKELTPLTSGKTLSDVAVVGSKSSSTLASGGPTASMATVTTVSTSTAHQSSPGAEPVLRTVTATTESHTGAVPPEQLASAAQIRGPVLVQTHEETPGAAPIDITRVVQRNRAGEAMTDKRQLQQQQRTQRISASGSGWQQQLRDMTGMGARRFAEMRTRLGRKLAELRRRARQQAQARHINPDDITLSLPRMKQLLPWILLPLLALALSVWGYRHLPGMALSRRAAHEQVVPYTGLEQQPSFEGHAHDVPAHMHNNGAAGMEYVPHHIDAHGQSIMPEGQNAAAAGHQHATPPPQQFVPPMQHEHVRAHVHMPHMHQQAPPQQFVPPVQQHLHSHGRPMPMPHVHMQQPQEQQAPPQQFVPPQQGAPQQQQDNQYGSFDRSTHAAHGVGGALHHAADKAREVMDEIKDDLQHVQHRMHRN